MNTVDKTLKRSSRMLALAGIASIAFGVIVAAWPNISLLALISLFGAFAFVSGGFMFAAGLEHLANRRTDWVPYILGGLSGFAVGAVTFFRPGVTGLVLLYLIAAWAIASGAFQIAAAFDLWEETHESWMLGLAGVLSIAFGVLIAVYPASGALAILWLIAFYAIMTGVVELAFSYRVHQADSKLKTIFGSRKASTNAAAS